MIARKKPIPRKRAKPRTWKSPRCDVRGCQKPQDVKWPVAPEGKEAIWSVGHRATDEVISSVKIVSPIFPSGAEYGVVSTYGSVTSGPWNGMCRSHAHQEALARWSFHVRLRGGFVCELAAWHQSLGVRCGGNIVGCHGFGKGAYPAVAFEEWNGFGGCSGINNWTDNHPLEWTDYLRGRWGDALYEERKREALAVRKYDLADVLARYPAAKKEVAE